jgi:hypothetical protein
MQFALSSTVDSTDYYTFVNLGYDTYSNAVITPSFIGMGLPGSMFW